MSNAELVLKEIRKICALAKWNQFLECTWARLEVLHFLKKVGERDAS